MVENQYSEKLALDARYMHYVPDYKQLSEKLEPYKSNQQYLKDRIEREVNKPKHYTFGKFEVIDVLMDWFPDDPLIWQVGKYIARYKHKENPLKDLKKAQYYLNKKIEQLEQSGAKY